MSVHKLSVLIPVYNELRTVGQIIDRVTAVELPCDREVIVIDDASTDGTGELLDELAAAGAIRLVRHAENAGKGAAVRSGIERVTGDWTIVQDADLEYDPADFRDLLRPACLGIADAVYGSRFAMGRYRRANHFWHTAGNRALTWLTNVVADLTLTDMETCYKLVRSDLLRMLDLESSGFEIEPEITVKLARCGARIFEVPISYRGRTHLEGKKIGTVDGLEAIRALVRHRFLDARYCAHEGFRLLRALQGARRFNRWLFSQVAPWLGQEVLEAGCGIGSLTGHLLDRRRLVCVDLDPFYVERVEQSLGHLANVSVSRVDLRDPDGLAAASGGRPFDSVLAINVLEHLEDDVGVVRGLASVLAPGGRLVVLVPHGPKLFSPIDRSLEHRRRYTRESLRATLEAAGLEVERIWGFNRAGGLGWRVSGRWLRRRSITTSQIRLFELLMPAIRLAERVPFHPPISLIAVATSPSA